MNKKIWSIILIVVIVFSCYACGSTNTSNNQTDTEAKKETKIPTPSPTQKTTVEPTLEPTVEPTPEPTKGPSIDPKEFDFSKVTRLSTYYMDQECFSDATSLISQLKKIVKDITPSEFVEGIDGNYEIFLYQNNTQLCSILYDGTNFVFDQSCYKISEKDGEKFGEIARAIMPEE